MTPCNFVSVLTRRWRRRRPSISPLVPLPQFTTSRWWEVPHIQPRPQQPGVEPERDADLATHRHKRKEPHEEESPNGDGAKREADSQTPTLPGDPCDVHDADARKEEGERSDEEGDAPIPPYIPIMVDVVGPCCCRIRRQRQGSDVEEPKDKVLHHGSGGGYKRRSFTYGISQGSNSLSLMD